MENIKFLINNKEHEVSIKNSPDFHFGKKELLSTSAADITYNQNWYPLGYSTFRFLNDIEFANLKNALTEVIKKIIFAELDTSVNNFDLENYHKVVKSNTDHFKVVSKTRDLFTADFEFSIAEIFPKLENLLGFKLTDKSSHDGSKMHIIIRINRPFSTDYNPPHKDIYEGVDNQNYIPQFVNFWIPICGVTQKSSLPIVPSSHLLTEDKILRTFDGGVIQGNKYRVRMIKEWDGSNQMERAKVGYGEALIFSSHLIHGLAINEESDITRVALEFRLFKRHE